LLLYIGAPIVAGVTFVPAIAVGFWLGAPLPVAALLVGLAVAAVAALDLRDRVPAAAAFAIAAAWILLVFVVTHAWPEAFLSPDGIACSTIDDGWRLPVESQQRTCATTGLYDLLFWTSPLVGALLASTLVLRVVVPRRWAA
jgi:hypothetical protein